MNDLKLGIPFDTIPSQSTSQSIQQVTENDLKLGTTCYAIRHSNEREETGKSDPK